MDLVSSLKRMGAYCVDVLLLFATLATTATVVERWLRITPQTPRQVWVATVLSFSIPVWLYFTLGDHSRSGATIGKKLFRLRVLRVGGSRVSLSRSLARTAIKLLPWEMAHLFGFALAQEVGAVVQGAGLIAANVLAVVYLIVLLATRGRLSVHDLLVDTNVVSKPSTSGPGSA
jgi:uncharacterized RDD family membrane protein YckC